MNDQLYYDRYLATGIVCGRNKAEVRTLPLPDQEKLDHIDNVHPDKLNNFYQVIKLYFSSKQRPTQNGNFTF